MEMTRDGNLLLGDRHRLKIGLDRSGYLPRRPPHEAPPELAVKDSSTGISRDSALQMREAGFPWWLLLVAGGFLVWRAR